MNDRELLHRIHGETVAHCCTCSGIRRLINSHFADEEKQKKPLELAERIEALEKIITAKGYDLKEEIDNLKPGVRDE